MKPQLLIFIILFIYLSCSTGKNEIYIAAGAGYRNPINEIKSMFEKHENVTVNCIYGNMRQITTQVKNTEKISIVIGDYKFLSKSGINFKTKKNIGKGRLVLAYESSLNIKSIKDLIRPSIKRIILPDARKTIYGRASHEALNKLKVYNKLKSKLIIVQTVPQVNSYLISGTAKAGFINKTDFITLDQSKFKSIIINENLYDTIIIEAATTVYKDPYAQKFLDFLLSENSKKVFAKYGMELK